MARLLDLPLAKVRVYAPDPGGAFGGKQNIKLEPPRRLTLELAMEFIEPDELIELTPDAIRLRKRELDPNKRRKAARDSV